MGIIHQGILGGVSGRVGSVVGASWKGIPTLRVYQPNVSNPDTTAQRSQRDAFKGIGLVGSQLLNPLIKAFWDRFAVKESGYNAFIKANKVEGGGFNADPESIVFSKGKLGACKVIGWGGVDAALDIDAADFPVSRFDLPSDEIFVIFYHTIKREYFSARALSAVPNVPAVRSSKDIFFLLTDLPDSWIITQKSDLKAAVVARRADGSQVSECVGLANLTEI